jgi:Fe-S-cluster-containing dehydrogenase component
MKNGLLIEYEYCTGCNTCIVACKQEHSFPVGKGGIKVNEIITEDGDNVRVDYIPYPTEFCNFCAARVSNGEKPSCVKHCMSNCMEFGPLDKLAERMGSLKRSVLYAPKASG